ncbi:chromosome segregation protein SMC [Nostocoides veronense]|uniref:Chromosome partition protein Smc n=1 Tax=Nostocoides veronense TaxID=330836 RepID=A0ABN2LX32_9MICO
MYVKSLTVKGFKSFASATTFRLEPGVTCIVGPNGSGKSNVVDALAWVMGEQGAKSLRGGKMEDVIFAGTSGRAPLGRAEVSMTIDNTDGALPIDYTEVTIRRTMFRGGGSEYAINGTASRLLDIQELLSDSGIGREMHVIVGQGQLDTVLRATPEERRGFIEEAAGVLKHRKRKEKALRKLETMEANLTRVADLTSEIRRQLGPLGRQAEAARRAAVIQAEARDARLRLLADELAQLTAAMEAEAADETALLRRRAETESTLARARAAVAEAEAEFGAAGPVLSAERDRWIALRTTTERLESIHSLAGERVRLLRTDDQEENTTGRDPDELMAQAQQVREQERVLHGEVSAATSALEAARTHRAEAEEATGTEQRRVATLARAAADRREGLAKLAGQVAARRTRLESAEAEVGRLAQAAEASLARAAEAEQDFAALEASIAVEEKGEEGLDAAYEAAQEAADAARAEVDRWREAERAADRERTALSARLDALRLGLRRKDGAAALLAEDALAVGGTLADALRVPAGDEVAIAAALGYAAEAVTAPDLAAAQAALDHLRATEGGRATVLVEYADTPATPDLTLPAGARWASEVVTVTDGLRGAVGRLLAGVVLVPDAAAAGRLLETHPDLTAVTPTGDVLAAGVVRGGSADAPSLIETQAAVDETAEALADAQARGEEAQFRLAAANAALHEATATAEAHLERLHESDATMAAVAEQLGSLGSAIRSARAEHDRLQRAREQAAAAIPTDREALAELTARLEAAGAEPEHDEQATPDRTQELAAAASAARAAETEALLAVRTKEERARALSGRAASLEGAARNELAARERLRERRERRRREATVAESVAAAAAYGIHRLAQATAEAHQRVDALDIQARELQVRLGTLRGDLATAQDELATLTDDIHRDEVARAAQQARVEQLQVRALDELGIDPEVLVEDFGPHQLVPVVVAAGEDPQEPQPYVRETQEKRLRRAERGLRELGRINPLALEEFAALEERHTFLTQQMEDLKASKRDLLDIVREVDQRVEEVFSSAFEDTAAQFERVFARLFPGGEGRIFLTDPSDMLTTGIEVEARPPGKKVKRLSLLSGGERSLVAVALLVAIFKARPSPFYIMDEVEAALDDTNLGRLITLFEELRDSSQLIVITHQKRTMEVADALYGVSMRGDGVTTVVSQRLRAVAETA